MSEQAYITKSKSENTSMNYEELREQGISSIQQLAPDTWTDHNIHDPGITILELLSYAITDLGHRTNYATRDILAENFDKLSPLVHSDYPIQNILPANPLTINDWRKFLIDIPTVKNAWLNTTSPDEPKIYNHSLIDTDNDPGALFFTDVHDPTLEHEEIKIKGLYEVYLELEEHEVFKNLNSPSIYKVIELDHSGTIKKHRLEFIFPRNAELHRIWNEDWTITAINVISLTIEADDVDDNHFLASVEIQTSTGTLDPIELKVYPLPTFAVDDDLALMTTEVDSILNDLSVDGILNFFYEKNKLTSQLLLEVKQKVLAHRNLCEDFLKIDLICYQDIVLHGDLIVKQGSDPNQVSAILYFLIDQFLRPTIQFRTLEDMKSLGYTIEQLFSGPLLENGFIHDEDLDGPYLENDFLLDKNIRSTVRNLHGSTNEDELVIYTSDLVRIIMCLKRELGIIAIRNFKISSYIDNVLQTPAAKNCIVLQNANYCKPKIDIIPSIAALQIKTESQTTIGEDEILEVDTTEVLQQFNLHSDDASQNLSSLEIEAIETELTPENGKHRSLQTYHSFQNDFPLTYGVGRAGLPPTVTKQRRAKARQLKAYLLFFEQFLANYQAQLGHLKELFSIDRRVEQTYFSQSLYNVPDAYLLLKDFVDSHASDIDSYNLISADWSTFKADLSNFYIKKIQTWSETPSIYLDRRSRFLDFLLARFGEDFNDYSALRYFVNQSNIESDLIECKLSILENIPTISRDRSQAFNYCALADDGTPTPWINYMHSGYRLRLTHLLGLKDNVEIYQEADADGIDEFRFRIKNDSNDILLSSSQHYHSDQLNLMNEHIRTIRVLATDISNYELKTTTNGKFYFNIIDSDGDVLARRIQYFDTILERTDAINEVIDLISNELRFHFIEHLLLRPHADTALLMTTQQENLTAIKDPYSFGLSVIFPAFFAPFDNFLFRSYAERIVYLETSAHLLTKIYWVDDVNLFVDFEAAYKAWLDLNATPPPADDTDLATLQADTEAALQTLIEILDTIRTT